MTKRMLGRNIGMLAATCLTGFAFCGVSFAQSALVSAVPQGKINFVPKSSTMNGGVKIEQGTVNGSPAVRMSNPKVLGNLIAVKDGSAKTWNQARAACRGLSPVGSWDLPTDKQFMMLSQSGAVDTRVSLLKGGQEANLYPMWARSTSEAANAKALKDKSILLAGQDGVGLVAVDISPAAMAKTKQQLAQVNSMLKKNQYQTPAEEKKLQDFINSTINSLGASAATGALKVKLPPAMEKIASKPSKAELLEDQRNLQNALGAFQNGFAVYCASEFDVSGPAAISYDSNIPQLNPAAFIQ